MTRPYLIDVSRLVWRAWTRRLPTGIDRVCLAYLDHYGHRAQAVVQRGGHHWILSGSASDRLFAVLRAGRSAGRARLSLALAAAALGARRRPPRAGLFYFNVGHTGLNELTLAPWIAANRLRAIYLVHDLIPLTHPQFCRAGEAHKHERRMTTVLASASGVIGNSQATLTELAAFAAAQRMAMPPSVAAWISGPPPRQRPPAAAPLATPYFVTLGTIEGRKNHVLLLRIWQRLAAVMGAAAPTLLIVGQRGWEAGPALEMLDRTDPQTGRVRELGQCDDDALANGIAGARALLMPSFAEGFGLPVIEALALGTPVIASNLPVFREIAGDIPTYLDPHDEAGWETKILAFSGDDADRNRQLALMADYRAPDWKGHFATVDAWLQTL